MQQGCDGIGDGDGDGAASVRSLREGGVNL